jgi:tRNA(Arg) A34 adenosine deaminase TadA
MNIRLAIKEALKARHRQHHHGAILLRNGKPIAQGHNSGRIHAEHQVLNKAWRNDVTDTTLLIVRVRKDGTLGNSRPCSLCTQRLIQAGIKKVVFSNNVGELEEMKLPTISGPMQYLEYHYLKPQREAK